MKDEKMGIKDQMKIVKDGIKELQGNLIENQRLLNKERLRKYKAWLAAILILFGASYIGSRINSRKNELESSLNAQLANANNRIEYLVDKYERYRLVDVFVFTTTYNDGRVQKELVTYDKYDMPGLTCDDLGKKIFNNYNILQGFDYFGEMTLFYSVRNGKLCGDMMKIYTHDNGNTEVTGKYTKISFNGDTQIKQVINDGDKIMSSINKNNGVKFEIKELRYVMELENKTYTKDELIEIEDMLNEKNKVLALSKN